MTAPYPFQEEADRAIESFGGRCLLGMEPGLGKSFVSIRYRQRTSPQGKCVVVCPANIKYSWQDQWRQHAGVEAAVLSGKRASGVRSSVNICNYDILGFRLEELDRPDLVILDECQYLCGRSTQRTKAVRKLCEGVPHVLALSGTPLVNRPAELWPVLNILAPKAFGGFYVFANKWCAPKRGIYGGWDYSGHSNLDQLHELLVSTCMFRMRRADALPDLPTKVRSVVPLEIVRPGEYRKAERDFLGWLAEHAPEKLSGALRSQGLSKTGQLKLLAARNKLPAVITWVRDFLNSGRKLILFCYHLEILEGLRSEFSDCCVATCGATGERDRKRNQDRFNGDVDCRLFVANGAAAAGWSASACSDVAFCELYWQPGVHVQMEDRVVGINRGVGGETPMSHYLIAEGTIERRICRIVHDKQKVLGAVLDGDEGADGPSVYDDLIGELRR